LAEARLQAELAEAKLEVQRWKNRLPVGTVNKDLSLITLVPKWKGTDAAVTLEEFISSI